jgi:hypothetical protein
MAKDTLMFLALRRAATVSDEASRFCLLWVESGHRLTGNQTERSMGMSGGGADAIDAVGAFGFAEFVRSVAPSGHGSGYRRLALSLHF